MSYDKYKQSMEKCAELGTDSEFQDFVRSRASCVSGRRPCVYAHVRRAAFSGTGMKPQFSGVPLTDDEHKLQHSSGESAVVSARMGMIIDREQAKEYFDKEAEYLRQLFIKDRTK